MATHDTFIGVSVAALSGISTLDARGRRGARRRQKRFHKSSARSPIKLE
jgi:hypothetical protein